MRRPGNPQSLTQDGFVFGFDFTADGRGVVYASRRGGVSALWQISASGGQPQRLKVSGSRAMWPSISRTGGRLAFSEGILDYNLWRTPLPGSGGSAAIGSPVRLAYSPQLDFQPSISPDGKRVAFASDRSGNFEIWTC